jgi:hypothetical protein
MAVVSSLVNALPTKTLKRIATYVEPEVFADLEKWADEEDRSISNLTSRLLTQAVKAAKSDGKLGDRTNGKNHE